MCGNKKEIEKKVVAENTPSSVMTYERRDKYEKKWTLKWWVANNRDYTNNINNLSYQRRRPGNEVGLLVGLLVFNEESKVKKEKKKKYYTNEGKEKEEKNQLTHLLQLGWGLNLPHFHLVWIWLF